MTEDGVSACGGWRVGRGVVIDCASPRIMGVINATPDSFYAGSRAEGVGAALHAAERVIGEGADIVDIGGESTRPGAARVAWREQVARVAPVVRAVRRAGGALSSCVISVDTTDPEAARAVVDEGADIINDVSGAGEHGGEMLRVVSRLGVGLVLMHRLREPTEDSYSDRYVREPVYGDVVSAVRDALADMLERAERAGVARDRVVIDPGLGFGKSVVDNLRLIGRTGELAALRRPVLSGLSRKSFVGRVSLGRESEPSERLAGTLGLSVAHLLAGAKIFRVHDVAAHREALAAAWSVAGRGA